MRKIGIMVCCLLSLTSYATIEADNILQKVDQNLSSTNRVMESSITIHGKRGSRTIVSKTYAEGSTKSFTEYLSPAREQGTKMLKLNNQLWIYSPSTDRTMQLSGHMLRQSVMGSDMSYEDMMDDRKLTEIYTATLQGKEVYTNRNCYVINLTAKTNDVAYYSQKMWVDAERYVPLKQELYAKSGQLLKRLEMSDIVKLQGRWFPMTMQYKDMLKNGNGTKFSITTIEFDVAIPPHIFTKAVLKR